MRRFWLVSVLSVAACGSGSPGRTDLSADAVEAATNDVLDAGDVPSEAETGPQCEWPIAVPQDTPDPSRTKFALTLFHFNIQYVAGGLSFVDDSGVEHAVPGGEGFDERRVEDWIVTETFAPVLDFYLAHPTWQADIELQGYFLDVLAERHPAVLDKLRTLTTRGQIELVSFHWSAQLFLAFPREDLERSIAALKEACRRYCLPLGGAVFDQEGQAGEGRQDLLVKEGYTVGIYPKNLWRHQHGDRPFWPYYKQRGGDLIVAPGGVDPASGIEVRWLFLDDGELLAASGKLDPYFAPFAQYEPKNMEKFAASIEAAEAAGFRIAHVSDYVRHLKARGVPQPEAPPLLDGTWQPQSTRAILRWLGGRGAVWWQTERDNEVRTGNAAGHAELVLAGTLRDHVAGLGLDTSAADALIAAGWRDLWLAEVSDATGINPWEGEIRYGLRHNAAALSQAAQAIASLKDTLGAAFVLVDSATGSVARLDDQPMPEPPAPLLDPPFAPVVRADTRDVKVEWFEDGQAGAVLEVTVSAATRAPAGGEDDRLVEVAIPMTLDRIRYSPGLLDQEVVDYPFSDFAWPDGELFLPLGNGLIAIAEGVWLIKDTRSVHLAARLSPDDGFVRFMDETLPPETGATWRFGVFEGTKEHAISVANAWNVRPSGVR